MLPELKPDVKPTPNEFRFISHHMCTNETIPNNYFTKECLGKFDEWGYPSEFSLIHWASSVGRIDVIELLLKLGEDINLTGECGYSPLHLACYNGQSKAAIFLMENGADPTQLSKYDRDCHFLMPNPSPEFERAYEKHTRQWKEAQVVPLPDVKVADRD